MCASLDDRYPAPKTAKHLPEFQSDIATSQNQQVFWHSIQFHNCCRGGEARINTGASHVLSLNDGCFPTRSSQRCRKWSSCLASSYYNCIVLFNYHVFLSPIFRVFMSCCIVLTTLDSLQLLEKV